VGRKSGLATGGKKQMRKTGEKREDETTGIQMKIDTHIGKKPNI